MEFKITLMANISNLKQRLGEFARKRNGSFPQWVKARLQAVLSAFELGKVEFKEKCVSFVVTTQHNLHEFANRLQQEFLNAFPSAQLTLMISKS